MKLSLKYFCIVHLKPFFFYINRSAIYIHICIYILRYYGMWYVVYAIYGIHHWRILRSSYRKLAWAGYEPTTTEFRSVALTDWAIRPWVQLALRADFVQCSRFILAIAFVSRHIFFKRNLPQVKHAYLKRCHNTIFWAESSIPDSF